jgi:hypothetical protein
MKRRQPSQAPQRNYVRTFIHEDLEKLIKNGKERTNPKPVLQRGISLKHLYENYTLQELNAHILQNNSDVHNQKIEEYYTGNSIEGALANVFAHYNFIKPITSTQIQRPRCLIEVVESSDEEDEIRSSKEDDLLDKPAPPIQTIKTEKQAQKKRKIQFEPDPSPPPESNPKSQSRQHKRPRAAHATSTAPKTNTYVPIKVQPPKIETDPQKWSAVQVVSWLDDHLPRPRDLNLEDYRQLKKYMVNDCLGGYHMTKFAQLLDNYDEFLKYLKILRIPDGAKLLLVEAVKVWKTERSH